MQRRKGLLMLDYADIPHAIKACMKKRNALRLCSFASLRETNKKAGNITAAGLKF